MAERFDTLVLHHATEGEDVFVVRDVDATYRLVIPGTPERRRGKPPVPGQEAAPLATEPPMRPRCESRSRRSPSSLRSRRSRRRRCR